MQRVKDPSVVGEVRPILASWEEDQWITLIEGVSKAQPSGQRSAVEVDRGNDMRTRLYKTSGVNPVIMDLKRAKHLRPDK